MLVKRIILLFFRDKANVFFSLLAVLIILGLYILFLGDAMVQMLQSQLDSSTALISVTMASLIMAGMVAVTSVTCCMGSLGIGVEDKETASKDFLTSPASRGKITAGYLFGSAVIGLIMTTVALVICVGYLIFKGGSIPDLNTVFLLMFTVVLSVLCGNSMVYFLSVFIKTQNAFSAVSTVIGTLIGFLMGIYMPIGQMPEAVQWVIKCFPMSHAGSMFRQLLADNNLLELFGHAPQDTMPLEQFREMFGVVYTFGDYTSTFWFSAGYLACATVIFFLLSLAVVHLRKNK